MNLEGVTPIDVHVHTSVRTVESDGERLDPARGDAGVRQQRIRDEVRPGRLKGNAIGLLGLEERS